MAVYKLFPEKDATLYSAYPVQNTGLDEIIEASTTYTLNQPEVSRFLLQFSQDEISDLINSTILGSVTDETGSLLTSSMEFRADLKTFIAEIGGLSTNTTLESYPISLPWNMGTGKYNDIPKTEDGCSWKYTLESGSGLWVNDEGKAQGARAITNNNIYTLPQEGRSLKSPIDQLNYITASYRIPEDHIGLYNGYFQKYYVIINPPIQRHIVRYSTNENTITGDIERLPVTPIYGKSFTGGNSFLRHGDSIYQDAECTIPYPSGSYLRQGQNVFYIPSDGFLTFSTASNNTDRSGRWLDCTWCHCGNDGDIMDNLGGGPLDTPWWNVTNHVEMIIHTSTPRRCCPAEIGCTCCGQQKAIVTFDDYLENFWGGIGDIDSPNPPNDTPPIVPNKLLGFSEDGNLYPVWEDLSTAKDYSLITNGTNIKSTTIGSQTGYIVIPSLTTNNNDIDSSVYNDLNSNDVRNARNSNPFTPSSSRVEFIEADSNYPVDNPGGGTWFTGSIDGLSVKAEQILNYTSDKDIKMDVTNVIRLINSGTIDNNGFIIKQSDSDEFQTSKAKAANIKYFSIDTHTIYPPQLEIKWRDWTFNTGSSTNTIINTQEIVATLAQNNGEYRRDSIQKFYINCRPQFPQRTFQTGSVYTTNYYLPTSSYYAIKDLATNEFIIDFDTDYTQISADENGSYFKLYMNGLEPERYYQILVKTEINGSTLVLDDNYYFKVING